MLVQLVQPRQVVAALALGATIGQTVVAVPLVFVTRRICGAHLPCRVSACGAGRWLPAVAAATVGVGGKPGNTHPPQAGAFARLFRRRLRHHRVRHRRLHAR